MAARKINVTADIRVADYHAYSGVSSARTCVDAFTCWLNGWFDVGMTRAAINLIREDFWKRLQAKICAYADPTLVTSVRKLRGLAKEIDAYPQPAQHRDGLPVARLAGVWRIAKSSSEKVTSSNADAAALLRFWADRAETEICLILQAWPPYIRTERTVHVVSQRSRPPRTPENCHYLTL